MKRVLARPGQSLSEHLDGVARNAKALAPAELSRVAETVAQLHDLGKYTSWFQRYIRGEQVASRNRWHASIGAIATLHALATTEEDEEIAVAGFYAVLKHHGALPDFPEYHTKLTDGERSEEFYDRVERKLQNIDVRNADFADPRIQLATDDQLGWEDLYLDSVERYRQTLDAWQITEDFYPQVVQLWSILTCADKLDAAGVDLPSSPTRPDPDRIGFEPDTDLSPVVNQLNALRTSAREEARDRLLKSTSKGGSVYKITLPTGFGKTFTGLDAGLHLANQKDGRLVYALPFTTVIDQIHDEIVNMFDVDPRSELYTIHHHLADTRTQISREQNEEPSDGTETMYGESWQAGLVLTTFVQLFESFAGPGNLQSIKLPALQDAVVIIDEPQAFPRAWWHLVSRLIHVLTERYNATVILMTATQPRFIDEFDVDLDPTQLVERDTYFEFLQNNQRVMFLVHESVGCHPEDNGGSGFTVQEAAVEIVESLEASKNVLVVNNTVRATAELVDELTREARSSHRVIRLGCHLASFYQAHPTRVVNAVQGDGSLDQLAKEMLTRLGDKVDANCLIVAGLTAALRPCDRALLIASIRRITDRDTSTPVDDLPLVLGSTQLIEAGVDVSFDRVYRDLAPIPSVVQTAGRCNRSFEGERGEVVLWRLKHEGQFPSQLVYGSGVNELVPTRKALNQMVDGSSISEYQMVTTGVREYYQALHEADDRTQEYDPLVNSYTRAEGESLREASLIDSETDDVLLITTDADRELFDLYLELRDAGEIQRGRAVFDTLKHLLASVTSLEELEPEIEEDEFSVVDTRSDPTLYDLESGRGLRQ